MLASTLRLTGLRREILAGLHPGRGVAASELRRRVALGRGLTPDSPGWPSLNTSFARALRLLERAGALSVSREETLFGGQACATWVALTPLGEDKRARVVAPDERALGALGPEPPVLAALEGLLARAGTGELDRFERLIAAERSRRNG